MVINPDERPLEPIFSEITRDDEKAALDMGFRLHALNEVDSTNRIAAEMGREGHPKGTVVVAEVQKGGKGRLDREWFSPQGGLWMSVLLKPNMAPDDASIITLLAGCAVAAALREDLSVDATLKWPNDVLVGNKKVCGILTEMDAKDGKVEQIVIGIGINVNNPLEGMPEDVQCKATNIMDILGTIVHRPSLVLSILKEIKVLTKYTRSAEGRAMLLQKWKEMSSTLGTEVAVESTGSTITGKALDLDEKGALIVETENGPKTVLSGDCIHLG